MISYMRLCRPFVAALLFSASPAAVHSAEDGYAGLWPNEARVSKVVDGTTICRSVEARSVCGVDRWTMTIHKDGSRMLRVVADDFTYNDTRYVTLHMGADGIVREAHIISHMDGEFFGSMNAKIVGDEIVLSYLNPEGAAQDTVALPEGPVSLGTGPAVADGWHFWFYDMDKGGAQLSATYWIGSPARGDMHGTLVPASDKVYDGRMDFKTPYGKVKADAFKYTAGTTVWVDPTDRYLHKMEMNLGPRGHYVFETVDLKVTDWADLVE